MFGRLVLLIAFLIAAVTILQLIRKTPKAELKGLYWKLGLSALALVLVLLALTGRIHWIGAAIGAVLPFVRQMMPLLVRHLPSLYRQRRNGPRSTTDGTTTSQANTQVLRMVLNHSNQRLSGEVVSGPYSGRQLDSLTLEQLQDLLAYCHRQDKEACRLLITYLNQRFGPGWQQSQTHHTGTIDETAAYAILGLKPGASKEEVITAHRRMMQKMHPDRGGSDYLAAQINQAKELLMRKFS